MYSYTGNDQCYAPGLGNDQCYALGLGNDQCYALGLGNDQCYAVGLAGVKSFYVAIFLKTKQFTSVRVCTIVELSVTSSYHFR